MYEKAMIGYPTIAFLIAELSHRLFISLDHFLDHLTADRACLLRSKVTVVALLKIYTNLSVRIFTY